MVDVVNRGPIVRLETQVIESELRLVETYSNLLTSLLTVFYW